jgi:putative MATE family efflux protein
LEYTTTSIGTCAGAEPKDLRDLTVGSVQSHLVRLALPIAAGMIFQTLYYIVDLYFVSHLGQVAIAGVGAAGNIVFLVIALTQIINAGTMSLLSQAVGRKDHATSNLLFNQSAALAVTVAFAVLVLGYPLSKAYMNAVGANQATIDAGTTYLACFLPGLALQFVLTAMGASLRATGLVKPIMIVQAVSLTLNIVLAPIMIAGWFTGHPLGVAGAGYASTIAIVVGAVLMLAYFMRLETYVHYVASEWRPRLAVWRRLLVIGLPAGGELAFLFLYTAVIFALIRHFGDVAQAGFSIGNRLTQAIFLPGMAIAFAAGPLAGQNFGAGAVARVRATLRACIVFCSATMLPLTLLCQLRPEWLVHVFTQDPRVVEQGTLFLRIISWNFVATGIIFSCSAMFQGLGNTLPSLLSTGSRLVTFVIPAAWMSTWPHFRIEDVWYLSVFTVTLQAATSLFLVQREFRRKFGDAAGAVIGEIVEI